MQHPRNEVREAVVALLKGEEGSEPTRALDRVYNSRDIPLAFEKMPAIVVYTQSDESDPETRHEAGLRRRMMDLRIEFYAMGDDAANEADIGSAAVEAVIDANPAIGGRVESIYHARTETVFAKEGQDEMFVSIMDFDVVYWITRPEEPGLTPRLFVGFDPETGPGNEDRYREVDSIEDFEL